MKYKKIMQELKKLEQVIRAKKQIEIMAATDLKQPDVSAWLNNKRKWSYEKILTVAEKMGL